MPLNIVEATQFAEDQTGKKVEAIDVSDIVAQQIITVGNASVAFNERTKVLRLNADEAVRVAFGISPSADGTTAFRMGANATEYVSIKTNATGFKLDTAAG